MNKKGLIIGIASAALVLAGVIVAFFMLKGGKEEAYRVIKVMSVEGNAVVYRENSGELSAYEGMALQNGDLVHTEGNAQMVLLLDDDKYAFVEENTDFALYALGSSANSKTAIDIQTGAVTCQVMNKLSNDSSYYINTPNSTMAIRGTVVRISVDQVIESEYATMEFKDVAAVSKPVDDAKDDIITVTRMTTFEGKAEVGLHPAVAPVNYKEAYANGTLKFVNDFETIESLGKSLTDKKDLANRYDTIIGGKPDGQSLYIVEPEVINPETYPVQTVKFIEQIQNDSEVVITGFSAKEIEELLKEDTHTVTFMYNGNVFGTQTVADGDLATPPLFVPSNSGGWATDFNTPVTTDVTIQWR